MSAKKKWRQINDLVFCAAALPALLASACARAADAAAAESSFFEDLPVVLTASRLPQSLADAPAAVTVLDREFIRATGYRDIARLLRLVPGFAVGQDHGHSSFAAYHGLSASFAPNKLQVLIDGRSVYSDYLAGSVDWSALPITIEEIDRIEVVRGSNSAAYGSNAFLGVVNIITRHSRQDQGAMLSLRGGSHGQQDGAARFAGSFGDLSLRMSAEHVQDNGFENLADDRRTSIATLRADYRWSPQTEFTLTTGVNSSLRVNGYQREAENSIRPLDSLNTFVHARLRYARRADEELSLSYYHNNDVGVEIQPFPVVGSIDLTRRASRDSLELKHYFPAADTLRVVWGLETRRDEVESAFFFPNTAHRDNRLDRAYANFEWRALPALLFNFGGMEEKYKGKPAHFAPRAFANLTVAPGHVLRAGVSRAYREPSLWEQQGYIPGIPRPTTQSTGPLHPERVSVSELGYLGQFPLDSTIDIRVFQEKVQDIVGFVSSNPRLIKNLAETAYIEGVEAQFGIKPWRGADLFFTHAMIRVRDDEQRFRDSTPPYSATLTWRQKYAYGISSTLSVISVGTTEWLDSQRVPSYVTWDGRVAWRYRLGPTTQELAVGQINGGESHEEWRLNARTPNPVGRFTYISWRTEF